MIQASVPELADGGYWYVVDVVPDPDTGGRTPGAIPGVGWCAWYSGGLVAVRTPDPVSGVTTVDDSAAATVLSAAGYSIRPRGRIGGS